LFEDNFSVDAMLFQRKRLFGIKSSYFKQIGFVGGKTYSLTHFVHKAVVIEFFGQGKILYSKCLETMKPISLILLDNH
jgi:hypothetical protein